MSLYVKSVLTGKVITVDLVDDEVATQKSVSQGFSQRELNAPLLYSESPFPIEPGGTARTQIASQPDNTLPPNPTMDEYGPAPGLSQKIILSSVALTSRTNPTDGVPYLQEKNTNNYYPVYQNPGTGDNTQYLKPPFPFCVYLLYRRYWKLVHSEFAPPGTPSLSGSYQVTQGMDTTTQMSLAAELGLMFSDLGLKLTATFGISVTIYESTSNTTDIQWLNLNPEKSWVVAKYQLVDDLTFAVSGTDPDSGSIEYTGIYRTPGHVSKHIVSLTQPDFPMGGPQFQQFVFGPF